MNVKTISDRIDVKFIDGSEWEDAMALCYRTFLKFDAAMYTAEGIRNFRDFVSDHSLKRMFDAGSYQVIGAYVDGELAGVVSLRDNRHISLLFVEEEHQHLGLGRLLVRTIAEYAMDKLHEEILTVNAAPYAVEFYHKIGFQDLGEAMTQDGITFTPMKMDINV